MLSLISDLTKIASAVWVHFIVFVALVDIAQRGVVIASITVKDAGWKRQTQSSRAKGPQTTEISLFTENTILWRFLRELSRRKNSQLSRNYINKTCSVTSVTRIDTSAHMKKTKTQISSPYNCYYKFTRRERGGRVEGNVFFNVFFGNKSQTIGKCM